MPLRPTLSRPQLAITSGLLATAIYGVSQRRNVISNDSERASSAVEGLVTPSTVKNPSAGVPKAGPFAAWAWGSNRNETLMSGSSALPNVKSPRPMTYVPSTPLNDLVLHESYGAAVDINGDVWMWGKGYFGDDATSERASASLRGKKITALAPTSTKLYALSSHSGEIYGLSSSRTEQHKQPRQPERYPWWMLGLGSMIRQSPGVDYVRLEPAGGLASGEKFASLVSGKSHILALTTKGRTFSMATDLEGNSHSQLGVRQPLPAGDDIAARDVRWNTTLNPITALTAVNIVQLAAGLKSSYFRMADGRVLGLGANTYGQLGLGSLASVEVVPVPSEIVLARSYPAGITVKCTNISAGGNNAYYTVERASTIDPSQRYVDLLSVGTGIAGGLGNGLWSSASSNPVKVKSVSGLQEYSETLQTFIPLEIKNVSVSSSPNAHIFATLNTVTQSEQSGVTDGLYGDDVCAWGGNADYQLGNGKRSNLAVPQHLPPITGKMDPTSREASVTAGTLTPMPHSRLQLHTGRGDAYDLDGKLLKRNVKAEQVMYAGYNSSASYWRAL